MEQTTICIDSQVTVAALGVSGTKSLLVADCIKKVTALSEVNQVIIIWVPGRSSQHSIERDSKLGSEEGSQDQIYQSGALFTTILELI